MKKKILVVDDYNEYVSRLSSLLEINHKVYKSNSFLSARIILDNTEIDFLITDVFLEDGNGMMLIEEAKRKNKNIFCIAISGYTEEQIFEQINYAGNYDGFFQKPLTKEKLVEIKEIIKNQKLIRNKSKSQ